MKLNKIRMSLLLLWTFTGSSSVFALDTGIKGFTVDGRLVQSYSVLYDLDEGGTEDGPANYTGEVNFAFRPDRKFTLVGNFWIRGMWNDPDWVEPQGGLKNLRRGPPFPSGSFQHGTSRCDLQAREFCAPNDQVDIYDDFNDDIIRELSVKYRDSKGRFTTKIGKFQRGWGQSDGLRLLDIVNPQDLRSHFVFKNSDELRIPLWMISTDFNFNKLGIAKPFEAIGMNRPVLELNIAPEIRHSEIVINNPTPGANTDGGRFGLPWPNLVDSGFDHQSGLGAVGFGAALSDNERDDFEWSDPEVSVRLKFETLGGTATLNGFYGYQDLPLVLLQNGSVFVGSGVNDASASAAVVPVDRDTLIAAIWAPNLAVPGAPSAAGLPSGYLPFLRGAAGKGPLTTSPLTALTEGGCNDPVNNPGGAGLECSVTANFDLDYTFRQKVVGFSFTRDMSDFISIGPKGTGPAFRAEVSHEFDKPFNTSVVSNPFIPTQQNTGSPNLLVSPSGVVEERDVTSLMLGLDYPLWVPGWKTQEKSIFTSLQWFNIHTENARGLLAQAPYSFSEVEDNQNFVTFLWDMKLDNQRLVAEGLYIRNVQGHGTAYRQRLDFNYFGKHWRPRIEWQMFDGSAEVAPVGIFNDKDFVEVSITYQF
jgi:hypothetical protein